MILKDKLPKEAGEIAGLKVDRELLMNLLLLHLAYGMDKGGKDKKIAVYDLGGGTFDISILRARRWCIRSI